MQEMIKVSQASKLRFSYQGTQSKRVWPRKYGLELATFPLGILLIIGLWTLVTILGNYPTFILPDPVSVYQEMSKIVMNGLLWFHIQATLLEIMGGLALGLTSATALGYLLAQSPLLER
jgi:ABC-type nitrate/sulfonate/bicarbonate transport system permease component